MCVVSFAACSSRVEIPKPDNLNSVSGDAININTATVSELDSLPYIGRSTAETIIEFRGTHGPFRRPEHLMLIRGISETRYLEIRDHIRTR